MAICLGIIAPQRNLVMTRLWRAQCVPVQDLPEPNAAVHLVLYLAERPACSSECVPSTVASHAAQPDPPKALPLSCLHMAHSPPARSALATPRPDAVAASS